MWVLVLVAAIVAAHWGAEQLAEPLKKLRRQWGFSAAAGGAFVGIAAASPEVGINAASAVRGVADIGLGAAIGSNILAIPLIVAVAYLASRKTVLGGGRQAEERGREASESASSERREVEGPEEHRRHIEQKLLRVGKEAVRVQALPYLGILVLFGVLTLPAAWRGLQPLDGAILLGAYAVYLAQALLRGRKEEECVEWSRKEVARAAAGLVVLGLGAYFTVRSTENLVSAFGIQQIVGGLFITAPMAALPEVFAVWSVTRSGQVTAATTSVIGDHAVTMTVAFVPLALVGMPVDDLQLFGVNLAFVFLVPVAYAASIHWGSREHGFLWWQVLLLVGIYLAYLAVMLFWVLNVV
jgi:cation:H+ antiporter